jgi:hypothetical protein
MEVGMFVAMEPKFLANLKRLQPGVSIIVMTSFGAEATVREAFGKGTSTF